MKFIFANNLFFLAEPMKAEDEANHGLLFLLAGITTRWKHIIRYELTGDKFCPVTVAEIICDIIIKAENDCGIIVKAISSDMGGQNLKI